MGCFCARKYSMLYCLICTLHFLCKFVSGYRIPHNLSPINYALNVKTFLPSDYANFDLEQNFTFEGNLKIIFLCKYQTEFIVLHSKNLHIDLENLHVAEIDYENNQKIQKDIPLSENNDYFSENMSAEIFTIKLQTILIFNRTYVISINYNGTLNSKLIGYYVLHYKEENKIRWMTATQLQPTFARALMPCFDEPEYKSVFQVTMIHPKDYRALSNSMEERRFDLGNGWIKSDFGPTPKMSTYLLALSLTEFDHVIYTTHSNFSFRIWTRKSFIKYAAHALHVLKHCFKFFREIFPVKYPLNKIDVLAVPDCNFGAMENYGLIVMREFEVIVDANSSQVYYYLKRLAGVMAHELAHQWFGNLVTMKWWDDVWLNEGFASYFAYVGVQHMKYIWGRSYNLDSTFLLTSYQTAMEMDSNDITSYSLMFNAESPVEIRQKFDTITYHKGATLIRMLQNFVNKTTFHDIIGKYLITYQFQNVNRSQFLQFISEEFSARNVFNFNGRIFSAAEFLHPFISQNGYPIVQMYRENDSVSLKQEQYCTSCNVTPISNNKWYIPVKYKILKRSEIIDSNTVWLFPEADHTTLSVNADSESIFLLNVNYFAYIRPNYNIATWKLIRTQLMTNHKNLRNFRLFQYITQYVLCDLTNAECENIIEMSRNWLVELQHNCSVGNLYSSCNKLPTSMRRSVYCSAVSDSGDEIWHFLWTKYKEEEFPHEKVFILYGLSCTKNEQLLKKLLISAIEGNEISIVDTGFLFSFLTEHTHMHEFIWNFVKNNWQKIITRYDWTTTLQNIAMSLVPWFGTEENLKQLEDFMLANENNLSTSKHVFEQILEYSRFSVKWGNTFAEQFDQFSIEINNGD